MRRTATSRHRTVALLAAAIGLATPGLATAATLGDYLHDGWTVAGFANATNAQLLLRRQDRLLLCTLGTDAALTCTDLTAWRISEPK
jgi:hypothetical protein